MKSKTKYLFKKQNKRNTHRQREQFGGYQRRKGLGWMKAMKGANCRAIDGNQTFGGVLCTT